MRVPSGGKSVKDVGEFPLISMINGVVSTPAAARVRIGIGDDAAVWKPRPGRESLVTTDILVENVHFRREWIEDYRDLGHKALAVNLSDVAAMGGTPRIAVVALGLRGTESERDVADLYRGMNALACEFGVAIVGGDTSASPSAMVINVTVIGETPPARKPLLLRSAARSGDVLAVTGRLGMAAAGLRVLQQRLLTLDGKPAMVDAYRRPQARVREGRLLVRCGVRAAMDLSDGLLGDLPKMCEQSDVSAIIDLPRVPIPHSIRWGFPDWYDIALRGGEDYELLFAAPPETVERVQRVFRRLGLAAPFVIGQITKPDADGPSVKIRDASGRVHPVEPGAFTHFGG